MSESRRAGGLEAARESGVLVHVVRHGQAFNTHPAGDDPYPPNPGLTPIGEAEARQLAARLRILPVSRVIASPMRRAVETANVVGDALALPTEIWPTCYEHRIRPGYLCWGARELRGRYPRLVLPADFGEDDWSYGDEAFEGAIARADRFLALLHELPEDAERRHVVVVTHGAFIRIVFARLVCADPRGLNRVMTFDNTSVTTLHVAAGRIGIISINDTSHLAGNAKLDPLRGINRT